MSAEAERALSHAIRVRVVLRLVAEIGLVLGGTMLVPMVGALVFGELELMAPYAAVGGALLAVGLLARRAPAATSLQPSEALVVAVAAFALAPVAMIVPLAQHDLAWGDALFEAVSGITTTGLSTVADLEAQSRTFLLARAWLQWIGGLGFVALSIALVMGPDESTRRLGAPVLDPFDVEGSMRAHARRVLVVYLVLTALGLALLVALGASPLDAVLHTLAGVSTGGFAPRDQSLAPLGRALQVGVLGVSLLGAVSLPLYAALWRRRFGVVRRNLEVRALLVGIGLAGGLVLVGLRTAADATPGAGAPTGLDAFLLALSAQTTVGFSTVSLEGLPAVVLVLLVLSMLSGGCEGSTAGGIKLLRILTLGALVRWSVASTRLPPHAVSEPRLGGEPLDPVLVRRASTLAAIFVATLLLSWLPFLWYGYPPAASLFEVASALGTVGLSTGITRESLEPFLKGVLCLNMWLGRLEVFAVLVAVAPRTWIGRRVSS